MTSELQWAIGALGGGAVTLLTSALWVGRSAARLDHVAASLVRIEAVLDRLPALEKAQEMHGRDIERMQSDVKELLVANAETRGRISSHGD